MNALEFIAFVLVFGGTLYFVWHDGFEQGISAGNRKHIKQWNRLFRATSDLSERIVGLDNRIDGVEARLAKLEHPDANVIYANDEPYAVVVGTDVESPYKDPRCDTCKNKNEGLICTACHDGGCYMEAEEAE